MRKLFSGNLNTAVILAVFFLASLLTGRWLATSFSNAGDVKTALATEQNGFCLGDGEYKVDDWPDEKSDHSLSWSDTPDLDCANGVGSANIVIKAGNVEHGGYLGGPNECYGFSWDQSGWSVWEKWDNEEEKGDCKDISHIIVIWTCSCLPPTTTPDPTVSPSPSPGESARPSPSPEVSPSPSPGPSEEPTPTPTQTPSPTPTDHNFQFGGPPPPPDAEGQVLGAQVLGLSDTSSGARRLNPYLFWLGIIMIVAGVRQTSEYLYARKRA